MHELIAALVHAEDTNGALSEAYRVFSEHTETNYQCDVALHGKRFDFFTILDPDLMEEQNIILEQMMKGVTIKVRADDVDGKTAFEEIPPDKDFELGHDYRTYYRGTRMFKSPEKKKDQLDSEKTDEYRKGREYASTYAKKLGYRKLSSLVRLYYQERKQMDDLDERGVTPVDEEDDTTVKVFGESDPEVAEGSHAFLESFREMMIHIEEETRI